MSNRAKIYRPPTYTVLLTSSYDGKILEFLFVPRICIHQRFFCPPRECFTHMKTSQLPMMDCKLYYNY